MNTSQRVDRASMLISASPERLYDAFIDPSKLAEWLPPEGARAVIDTFEPRSGGAFQMTLVFEPTTPGGKTTTDTDVVSARFVELIPARSVVWAINFDSDDRAFSGTMTMTWTLVPQNGGTLVSVEAADVPPGIERDDHEKAMASSLANLAKQAERSGA